MTERPKKRRSKANTPPPGKYPSPKKYTEWTTEEYLEALEEDQEDRRDGNR